MRVSMSLWRPQFEAHAPRPHCLLIPSFGAPLRGIVECQQIKAQGFCACQPPCQPSLPVSPWPPAAKSAWPPAASPLKGLMLPNAVNMHLACFFGKHMRHQPASSTRLRCKACRECELSLLPALVRACAEASGGARCDEGLGLLTPLFLHGHWAAAPPLQSAPTRAGFLMQIQSIPAIWSCPALSCYVVCHGLSCTHLFRQPPGYGCGCAYDARHTYFGRPPSVPP